MLLFKKFPPVWVLFTFHFVLVGALIFLCFGIASRTMSITAGIALLLLKGFIYSLGKINHDILLSVVFLVMAFSGWGRAYSVDAHKKSMQNRSNPWVLTLLALIVGFMMFTAGLPKILGGWLNISTHATKGHYINEFIVHGRHDLLAPYAKIIPTAGWELLDYATVIFEVGFLLAVLHPKSTRFFVCLAVLFHFSTMMILNIAFLPNFLAYAAFLNWDAINHGLKRIFPPSFAGIVPILFGAGILVLYGCSKFLGAILNLHSDLTPAGILIVCVAVPIALYGMYSITRGNKHVLN